jgi:peptidoglycan/LPS O-acetylase OafA/YrhL
LSDRSHQGWHPLFAAKDIFAERWRASVSNDRGTLPGVQALRGFAATMVVCFHATRTLFEHWPQFGIPVWTAGQGGVDVFFVISGLVMSLAASRSGGQNWRVFAVRRIIRIVPMYWIATTVKLATMLLVPALITTYVSIDVWHIVASYLFIPARGPSGELYPLIFAGWTLNFEMFFYLVFTIGLALRVSMVWFMTWTIGCLAIIGILKPSGWPAVTSLLDPLLLEFLAGVWLGRALPKVRQFPLRVAIPLALLSFWILCAAPVDATGGISRVFGWGLPGAALVLLAARTSLQITPVLVEVGDASYAIYLWHAFVLSATARVLKSLPPTQTAAILWMIAGVVLCAVVGIIIYRVLEGPMTARLNRWAKAKLSPPAPDGLRAKPTPAQA